jgi:hypothetical protein
MAIDPLTQALQRECEGYRQANERLIEENQRLTELLESHISKFNFYADLFCELEEQIKELTDD